MDVVKLNDKSLDERIQKDITKQPDRPKQEQLVKGTKKQKNIVTEIFEPIINRSISEIVVTALATVSDIIIGAVDMKLYGENKHKSIRGIGTSMNYNSLYRQNTILKQPTVGNVPNLSSLYRNPTSGFRVQDVVVPTRGDAEIVIDALCEKLDRYGVATVGDFYDAVGIPTTAIDFKYGWVNLSSADKHRTFDGYAIILPTPKPLDD